MKYFLSILVSLIIFLFIAEGVSRIIFDPIDFLKPRRLPDDVLRYRIEPGTGAHDSLGFRNSYVPEEADIVAIGDSHTYGISARARDSWPSALGRITGKTVYNMSLGGYGPAEYLYLMQKEALALRPKIIIVGFYLGNDIKDSFTAVYSVRHWKGLRKPEFSSASESGDGDDEDLSYGIADWLAGHSVLYRLVSTSFVGDALRQQRRMRREEEIVMFRDEKAGIDTGFTPDERLRGLDLKDGRIREGLDLSLGFFNMMNELAHENKIDFLVVIIPTKESVFAKYLEGNTELPESSKIDYLIENERKVDAAVKINFREHGIKYIDMLEPLSLDAGVEQIYPGNFGGHENQNGYRIIAESVGEYLNNNRGILGGR